MTHSVCPKAVCSESQVVKVWVRRRTLGIVNIVEIRALRDEIIDSVAHQVSNRSHNTPYPHYYWQQVSAIRGVAWFKQVLEESFLPLKVLGRPSRHNQENVTFFLIIVFGVSGNIQTSANVLEMFGTFVTRYRVFLLFVKQFTSWPTPCKVHVH